MGFNSAFKGLQPKKRGRFLSSSARFPCLECSQVQLVRPGRSTTQMTYGARVICSWQSKAEVLGKKKQFHCHLGSNAGLRGKRPATKRLIHGTAINSWHSCQYLHHQLLPNRKKPRLRNELQWGNNIAEITVHCYTKMTHIIWAKHHKVGHPPCVQ